jgi:hypothetical protein
VLVHARADFYAAGKPGPDDMVLLIEVMDLSGTDRSVKLPLYARAGISEVWLLDRATDRVEVYRHPSHAGYRESTTVGRNERLTPRALPIRVTRTADAQRALVTFERSSTAT